MGCIVSIIDGDHYVYGLQRPWDGSLCYVGKGKGWRKNYHNKRGVQHPNKHLSAIYARAGENMPIVMFIEGVSEEVANGIEKSLIFVIGRGSGKLVNATDGGEGVCGHKRSAETRAKASATMKAKYADDPLYREMIRSTRSRAPRPYQRGNKRSPEAIEKGAAKLRGRKMSDEVRRNLSQARQGEGNPMFGKPGIWLGRQHSDETKEKIRQTKIGKKYSNRKTASPETRARMSEAQSRRWARAREGGAS